jgi:hypothetical protein
MWELGLRPQYSFSGNICFEISVFCLCSVCGGFWGYRVGRTAILRPLLSPCVNAPFGSASAWCGETGFVHVLSSLLLWECFQLEGEGEGAAAWVDFWPTGPTRFTQQCANTIARVSFLFCLFFGMAVRILPHLIYILVTTNAQLN